MKSKFITLLMILTLALAAGVVSAQDEPAPIPIAVGEEATGTIDGTAAIYSFEATAGQTLIVDVLSPDFEPIAEVNAADGSEVAFSFGGDTFASVVFTVPADGTYTFPAGEFMGEGSGSYTVRLSEAGALTVDAPVEGVVNSGTNAYTFQGTGETLTVIRLEKSGQEELELELYDSAGTLLASDAVFSSSTEAIIEYLLPADGQYTVAVPLWFATDVVEGAFTLSLSEITPTALAMATPADVAIEGIDREYYFFEGAAGSAIHLTADSGSTEEAEGIDVNLEIVGPDGEIFASDFSDGPFSDPAITRVILPMDGLYLVKVIPDDDDAAQAGNVSLLLEEAEILMADAGSVNVALGERWEQDFVYFNAEPGMQYTITITPDRPTVSYTTTIGEGLFTTTNVTVGNGDNVDFTFTTPEDSTAGLAGISLRQTAFQNPTSYTVTLTPAQ